MGTQATTYGQFGLCFLREAVTAARVRRAIVHVAGDRIDVGPMAAGPGGIATATAVGRIRDVTVVADDPGEPIRFTADLRIAVDLGVDVRGIDHAYRCDVVVRLRLTVRTADPPAILIDVADVAESDVAAVVKAAGLRAKLLQHMGSVDREVHRAVRKAVDDVVRSPRAARFLVIDLAPLIDVAWPSG